MSTCYLFSTGFSHQMYISFVLIIYHRVYSVLLFRVTSSQAVYPKPEWTIPLGFFCATHAVIWLSHVVKLCFKAGPGGHRMEIFTRSGGCAAKFSRTEHQPASLVPHYYEQLLNISIFSSPALKSRGGQLLVCWECFPKPPMPCCTPRTDHAPSCAFPRHFQPLLWLHGVSPVWEEVSQPSQRAGW